MTTNKKYDYQVIKNKTNWSTQITRRVTSKKTTVSKSQDGFATEAEAKAWGEKELAAFLENLTKRNKREFADHIKNKEEKAARDAAYKQRKKDREASASEDTDADDLDQT